MTFSDETMLRHHLQHNMYPPMDLAWLPVAKAAIRACADDEGETLITIPAGLVGRSVQASAYAVVGNLHLEGFVAMEDAQSDTEVSVVSYITMALTRDDWDTVIVALIDYERHTDPRNPELPDIQRLLGEIREGTGQ
jgi:hypothetical protein